MRKTTFAAVLITAIFALTSCDKETILNNAQTPSEITAFVTTHFPNHQILQTVKNVEGFKRTYDVILNGNISLEFNRKLEIIDIDADTQLPESVIPAKIGQYVSTNFPENFITDWELEDKHQQVGLDNDLDLEFTMSGDFVKIDD